MTKGMLLIKNPLTAGCLLIFAILQGCMLSGGTHGSIRSYDYAVTKAELETAVNAIVRTDTTIHREFNGGYYNDTENYVTLSIYDHSGENEYTFRYAGDSLQWANSTTSTIFICYIYDGKGNGGSAGNGKWDNIPDVIKKQMTDLFEKQFIAKLDTTLHVSHTGIH